jgi:quinoprotein glucose dehydrogenase
MRRTTVVTKDAGRTTRATDVRTTKATEVRTSKTTKTTKIKKIRTIVPVFFVFFVIVVVPAPFFVVPAVSFVVPAGRAQQPQPSPYTSWSDYGGSRDSMQYSALAQINRINVKELAPAWFYPVPGDATRLPFNPLVVDDVMYVSGVKNAVAALDAATGKELWTSTERATERGLTYWESTDRSDRRLIVTTAGGIREINARNGELIRTFGRNGLVDMRITADRRLGGPPKGPGRVFENLIIMGSNTGEGYGSPPGDVRAYNVITGALVWTFHTIPRPGEYGYETWPPDAWKYAGGANTWGDISIDTKNGIAFFPTGSPTHDLYGADRAGDNLFGNCLLALDARTGRRLWHFHVVHHDLWDYDLTAAPKLLTVRDPSDNKKTIDIVAQAGKTGFLYVFERRTGKPLWPIEERPVPKSGVVDRRFNAHLRLRANSRHDRFAGCACRVARTGRRTATRVRARARRARAGDVADAHVGG